MAGTVVKIKQSAVAGRLPTHSAGSTYIEQGELALNTADQKLYSKDSSGTVFEIGGGGAAGANEIITTDFTATNAQTTYTVPNGYSVSNDHINVYYNGIKLSPDEYTNSNGTTVVLDVGAVTGATISIEVIKALNLANGSDITEYEFTATASQTSFAISGGYNNLTSDIEVYVNGVKIPSADFTATDDANVVLGTGAAVNDQVAIRVIKVTVLTSTVSQTSDTGAAIIPAGTTAQRDGSPSAGYLRWNSTLSRAEVWNGSAWTDVGQQTLTTEEVQDIIGGMVSSNTETDIAVTYDDTNGKINFVLDFSNAEVKTAYEANSDTNAYTDAEKTKVSNLSGTNTGDQTITLTGNVTGSGTGSFAATIAADAVTYAKIQNVSATNRILGRDSAGAGIVEEISPASLRTMINVEDGSTADQTGAQIKTAYQAETNAFTDAQFTKLSNIETAATADQTGAQIKTLYQAETNAFTDAQFTKLSNIETAATADQTAAEIRTLVGSATDSNVYTDALNTKLAAIEASADVTDATNVNAAGALMLSDTTTAGLGIVVDEDNMASNLATKVPTQQSVKAYVDSQVTAQDLDFSADSGGALSIDLDSEAITFTGGTGITTVGNANDVSIGIDSTVTTLIGTQTLTNKTLTSPVLNTGVSGTAFLDEDNMVSNSATKIASQQSIKAYVDTQVATKDALSELSGTLDDITDGTTYKKYSATEKTKLAGIEASATADQTNAEIKTAYEANADTNEFSDAEQTKLAGIEASATADQTNAEIRTAVEAATNSNVFTDADHTKLNAIEAAADVTDTTNVVAALTAGTNIAISAGGTVSSTDTNTTYSAGTGITLTGTTFAAGPIALTTVQVAANQTAQLALTAQEGDVAVRSDEKKSYMHNGGSAGTMADWTELQTPTDSVLSVNGNTGAITAAQIATAVEAASDSNTFTDADHTKLNAIEASATADQTNAEIVAAVEAGTDSNTFTDADHTKLNAIEASATADQTNAEIVAAVEAGSDSNTFTDADHSKLNAIEASATADQTAAEIRTLVGSATDSNVYTDALNTKLAAIEAAADVTDATNVNAAGALMLSDTTTAGLGIVVDEDNMASNSATKLSTQQAIKAYVDAQILTVPDAVAMAIALG